MTSLTTTSLLRQTVEAFKLDAILLIEEIVAGETQTSISVRDMAMWIPEFSGAEPFIVMLQGVII